MANYQYRYVVECLSAGQPRPYADSECRYTVLCEVFSPYGKPEERNVWKPRLISNPEDQKKLARALCRNFYDNPEWHQARLTSISQTPDGVLHVHITEPSTD